MFFNRKTEETPDLAAGQTKRLTESPIVAIAETVPEPINLPRTPQKLKPSDATVAAQPIISKQDIQEISAPAFIFWIPGPVTPKARPRVTTQGTFLPKRYRQWRLMAEGEIIMQIQKMNPPPQLPIQRAAIRILLYGQHRGDGDNSLGSVCDALVSAGVIPSDSLKHLPYGSWRHIAEGETGVKIQIRPLD